MLSSDALKMKPQIIANQNEQERLVISRSEPPVELRSTASYPLLVDPEYRAASEHFAILRARLLKARQQSGIHTLVIASPQKQDGKSLTSTNLAISLAQLQNERILLIDGDLRLSGITRFLGLEGQAGVADFLQQQSAFERCVKATTLSHLHVAPAGNVTEDALPAILEGGRWAEFLQRSKSEFGFIIVDSVPITAPIADFELLLGPCDALLVVVHVRKTTRDALDLTAQQVNGKLLGVVVNNFEPRTDSDYRSYYGGERVK